jgi:hypothetical protein
MATVTNRYSAVLGPIKMEILNLTAVTDEDTVTTLMQGPVFAIAVPGTDAAAISVAINVGVSGKTLTINSSDLSAEIVNVLVFGF